VEKRLPWYLRLKHERQLRGWSQSDVANIIESDLKTVNRWERGKSLPGPYFRQRLSELYRKSIEELGLIEEDAADDGGVSEPEDMLAGAGKDAFSTTWQEDWGEAPHIEGFYGREQELAAVERWIIDDRCRVIAILGIGGIGKTTFATFLAHNIKDRNAFKFIYWRSLQNVPKLEDIVEGYLRWVSGRRREYSLKDTDGYISALIASFREHRSLLILDNVESILQESQRVGHYQPGYEDYGRLFQRIGETQHPSCLLLTSREKPKEVTRLEGNASRVRSLSLSGVELPDAQKLLEDKALVGSQETWATFVSLYSGNPFILKLISASIREIFYGDIARFLSEEQVVFGDIQEFLDRQFQRLSDTEKAIMFWLAIEREAISLNDIHANMLYQRSKGVILEVLDSLRRRSMIEPRNDGRFALQPLILDYLTEQFVDQIYGEIAAERLDMLDSHALIKAQVSDYIRNSQSHFILVPLTKRLLSVFGQEESEKKLKRILVLLHTTHRLKPGYAAGNILNLLIYLQADLRGIDFSHLVIRQANLQNVSLPEVNFGHADLSTSVFTDTFASILCLAVSPDGALLAAGTTTVEVRLWRAEGVQPLFTCLGHTDEIRSIAFSSDGRMLASGGDDQTVRIWDTSTGRCLLTLQGHSSIVRSVAFLPNTHIVASGSEDLTIRLWDAHSGECLNILRGHERWIRAIACSPDGNMLISGSDDQTVRLWDVHTGQCLKVLSGHTNHVRSVVCSPTGKVFASGSEDRTIRLWDAHSGECLMALTGHSDRVRCLTFSPDGNILASASDDQTIRLWDAHSGHCLRAWQGHRSRIWSLVFYVDGGILVSASDDDTLRFWRAHTGECLRTLQSYTSLIKSVSFSPTGDALVSGSEDQLVRLWDVHTGQCLQIFQGHTHRVRAVAFSPNGVNIVSGSEDETVRIWDARYGYCLHIMRGHTHLIRSVAFSGNGSTIASGSHDQTIRLWDAYTGRCLHVLREANDLIWSVAFSADSRLLAGGSEDGVVRIWDVKNGQCLSILRGHTHRTWSVTFSPVDAIVISSGDDQTIRFWDLHTNQCLRVLQEHTNWVRAIAISPDGRILASGSHDQTIRLWDVYSGQCLRVLSGHNHGVWSVAFSPIGDIIASSSDDGTIKVWNVQTGECLRTLRGVRPYEGMNIANAVGLTEGQKETLRTLGAVEEEKNIVL